MEYSDFLRMSHKRPIDAIISLRYLLEEYVEVTLIENLCTKIQISLQPDGAFLLEDDAVPLTGPLTETVDLIENLVMSLVMRTNGYFPLTYMNAFAAHFRVEIFTGQKRLTQDFQRGWPITSLVVQADPTPPKRRFRFLFDNVFGEHLQPYSTYTLFGRLRELAALFPSVAFQIHDEAKNHRLCITYPNGLSDYLEDSNFGYRANLRPPIYLEGERERQNVKLAFHYASAGPRIYSFVNHTATIFGGSHEDGLWVGLMEGWDTYLRMTGELKQSDPQLRRSNIKRRICAVLAITLDKPEWNSSLSYSIKEKRAKQLVRSIVREKLPEALSKHQISLGQFVSLPDRWYPEI